VIDELIARELERFRREHPRSAELYARARGSLFGGVPMPWMMLWAGGYPVAVAEAFESRVVDVDGHEYIDLCLGDTGAMAGHAPAPVRVALAASAGITTMLPTEDAAWVGEELTRRFGLARWLFTLTATDANRTALRIARLLTGRPKVLVYSYCYHGSVDEAFAVSRDGRTVSREGNVGPPVDVSETTVAVEFNDLDALERALATGEIACVLAEPAMTNMGIVLPEAPYHEVLRALTREHGTLLIIDETHTFSAGPGGCTQAWGLEPDLLTIGKAIGGGVPTGALGLSADVAERMLSAAEADYEDTGGVGGTLAGNALSLAAARATLGEVLTDSAFAEMSRLRERFVEGVEATLERHTVPWSVVSLGARAEYRFAPEPPRTGAESAAAADRDLEEYLHLYLLNRGVLITPFHNMALMCPATTPAQVDRHTEIFGEAVKELFA
jgi:glutamate-1-semialdehyde 2,1-aminomutase